MIDPTIWKHRAELTISGAIDRALDDGAKIDDVERVVRASTPHPFGSAPPDGPAAAVWNAALDEMFTLARIHRRRKGKPPP
jgi:hypothetical protein